MMRVTLDTNILIYAAQQDDPRQGAASRLLARAVAGDCVQTLQSLSECFHVLLRKRLLEPAVARGVIGRYRQLFEVVPPAPDDLDEAADAALQHRLQFWDCLLWSTARRAGCRVILTEDMQDGRTLGGVRFMDPFRPGNAQLIDLILPSGEP